MDDERTQCDDDGTVRNSLGDLIQFVYGEYGMEGAFVEKQTIDPFALNDEQFTHRYRVDVMDPEGSFMPRVLQVGIDDSSLELQSKLDQEYGRIAEDHCLLRDFVFPRTPTTQPHYLPVNLYRILENSKQIFHINSRKPSDCDPAYVVDTIEELGKRLVVVRGDDAISREGQSNATLLFRMHVRSTLASRNILEEHHLTREAFDWVVGEIETTFNQSVVYPGDLQCSRYRSSTGGHHAPTLCSMVLTSIIVIWCFCAIW